METEQAAPSALGLADCCWDIGGTEHTALTRGRSRENTSEDLKDMSKLGKGCVGVCVCLHAYVCAWECVYMSMWVYVYICIRVCMCVFMGFSRWC